MNREELLQISKPILFSTEMTRAILDDRKKMTRRVIKVENPDEWDAANNCRNHESGADVPCYISRIKGTEQIGVLYPKYDVGDILYVRETWAEFTDLFGEFPAIVYKADMDWQSIVYIKWRPSIHMPKEVARIFLRVTDVRAERLQDILCGDMKKEGCIPITVTGGQYQQWQRDYFIPLWNSTIKKTDLPHYGWKANPWVWVYEFERVVEE